MAASFSKIAGLVRISSGQTISLRPSCHWMSMYQALDLHACPVDSEAYKHRIVVE